MLAMRLLHDPALLSATIASIYDCALDPGLWPSRLAEMGALIGARRAALGVISTSGRLDQITALVGYHDLERTMRFAPLNPLLPVAMIHQVDRSFVSSREIGMEALKATRFWREYLEPDGDLDAVGFLLTREGDAFGHWVLVTQNDRPPITEEEAEGLTLLAPHVRRAVEISCVLGARKLQADTMSAALDELESAIFILDGERRLTFANARAEATLRSGTTFALRDGRLRGATESLEGAMRRAAEEMLAGGALGFDSRVTGADGEERLLFVVALGHEDRPAGRRVMLVMRSPREETRNPIAIAAREFGLTAAQVQVLSFLAQGHSPDAIADILGISTRTVRAHLADLFSKSGTSRQAELVARTLSLASPLRQDGPGSIP